MLSIEILIAVGFTAIISATTLLWILYDRKRGPDNARIYLGSVFEFAPDAILLVASDGKILLANKRTEAMFDYGPGELVGKSIEILIPEQLRRKHESFRAGYISSPRVRPMGSGLVLYGRRKDASEFPVDIMLSPIQGGRNPTVIAIVRDVTVRLRSETERLEAISMVARSLAHDLRNPLTAIASASYVLGSEIQMSEGGRRMLKLIDRNISAADSIVMNLLAISSIVKPRIENLRLDLFLKDVLAKIAVPANVTLEINGEKELQTANDPNLLSRALTNLCINALESMPNGGKLSVSTSATNDQILIRIADTGVGMPDDVLGKLGTLFFTTKARGMGIGFAISKKFIESTGGKLHVNSERGVGTTVEVSIARVVNLEGQISPVTP